MMLPFGLVISFGLADHGGWLMANYLWEAEPEGDGGDVFGGGNTCGHWLGD